MCLHLLLQGFEVSSFQGKKMGVKIDSVMGQFDGVIEFLVQIPYWNC